ncbi:TPA: type II secretion system protein [Candidatus Ventrenecus stercoripullorum]|nr:type II secretion system protein [Candidatus Ventrenecus stercoripullorum]
MKKVLSYVKNNKGFTLIELLAVIVILAILMLVASTNIFNILDNARRGSFRTEFLTLLESAETTASMDLMNGTLSQTNNTKCYVIDQSPLKENFSNNGNYTGSVLVTLETDGSLTTKGWMRSNYYTVTSKTDGIQNNETDIPASNDENNTTDITTCGGYIS